MTIAKSAAETLSLFLHGALARLSGDFKDKSSHSWPNELQFTPFSLCDFLKLRYPASLLHRIDWFGFNLNEIHICIVPESAGHLFVKFKAISFNNPQI